MQREAGSVATRADYPLCAATSNALPAECDAVGRRGRKTVALEHQRRCLNRGPGAGANGRSRRKDPEVHLEMTARCRRVPWSGCHRGLYLPGNNPHGVGCFPRSRSHFRDFVIPPSLDRQRDALRRGETALERRSDRRSGKKMTGAGGGYVVSRRLIRPTQARRRCSPVQCAAAAAFEGCAARCVDEPFRRCPPAEGPRKRLRRCRPRACSGGDK